MLLLNESVEVEIEVKPEALEWPEEGAAEAGEGSNRCYVDLTHVGWSEVDFVLRVEEDLLTRCLAGVENVEQFWERALENEDPLCEETGLTLDIGTLTVSYALNAAGCPTSMSCNGHGRQLAYVQFWARPEKVPLLIEAAAAAGVGMCNHDGGGLDVHSNEVTGLLRFGKELRRRSSAFRAVRTARTPRTPKRAREAEQFELPFGDETRRPSAK